MVTSLVLGLLNAHCSARPAATTSQATVPPAPAASVQVAPDMRTTRPSSPKGRQLLFDPPITALPFSIVEVPGARSALLVSQAAETNEAWIRRIDGQTHAISTPVHFPGEHFFGAFDWADGASSFVTSNGSRICVTDTAHPGDPSCAVASPSAIVQLGGRLALLELSASHPQKAGAKGKTQPRTPARGPKRKPGKERSRSHKDRKHTGHAAPPSRPSRPIVELLVRWMGRDGHFDEEAHPTGLRFEAPLDGMSLLDARSRPPVIDLLWVEASEGGRDKGGLGRGRVMAGSLRETGQLDLSSRVPVLDADVEYGRLRDHRDLRLRGGDLASTFVDFDAKGQCEAIQVRPGLKRLAPLRAVCSVAPDRLEAPVEATALARFEQILAQGPRRLVGQPKGDMGLVAWAGDRAYFEKGGTLVAAIPEGELQELPAPFVAHRARLRWAGIATDGEGVAFTGESVLRIDGRGEVVRAPVEPATAPVVLAEPVATDGMRAVRLGTAWWTSRGPKLRLFSVGAAAGEVKASALPENPDTSVLVGGPARGTLIELSAPALIVSTVEETGSASRVAFLPRSPVRVGFDACERSAGGALVAGVSATDPTKVIAFAVDADGRPRDTHAVPLPIRAGELAIRLTPLPMGGAMVTDLARRHVVWLDEEGRPQADADWPPEERALRCLDGVPLRASVPSALPGQFVRLPDVDEGTCVVGPMVYGRDGKLRWFESAQRSLDASAYLATIPLLPPVELRSGSPVAPVPVAAAAEPVGPRRHCPGDMVSIAGRYCVDRFEGMILNAATSEPLSPDYPTTPNLREFALGEWATGRERVGSVHARAFPMPWIDPSRISDKPEPIVVSRLLGRPSGYLTGLVAEAACAKAGKRLCTLDEFVTACRGEADTLFPYGDTYVEGACNVFRDEHPAAYLHDNASVGHLDPRLNRVTPKGYPLLRRTGETLSCRSPWGDDAVYDMVGNLDEWVDESTGAFAGGFYARSTRSGCEALVTAHPKTYLDYSTGVRCCKAALE